MSHANGEVIHECNIVGHFEYNGTTDVACSKIYESHDEMQKHWRDGAEAKCTCGERPTDVLLYTDYADGHYWPSTACLKCGAITGERCPWELGAGRQFYPYGNGLLDVVCNDEWPKDGHPLDVMYRT